MQFTRKTLVLILRIAKFRFQTYWNTTNETEDVNTTTGPIRGVKRYSCLKTPYYSFERVPYARPPINELRFTDPEPPLPWSETLDCTKEASPPIQINPLRRSLEGDEDCLYLSVYTKNINPQAPLPVMVWIYGGSFATGMISKELYSPDYFMEKDVVIVSIQYRLGSLGFLSFKDPNVNVPGNAGLKDQTLGLKWVKENIEKFGGDPENITLFGESAGGASCSYQTISEHSKGLFHKAILMSGTALEHWAVSDTFDMTYRLAKALGYQGAENDKEVLEFLRAAKPIDLAHSQYKLLTDDDERNRTLIAFGPCIEAYEGEQCMIPKDPRLMMREGWGNDIPIILGGTSDEGLFSYEEATQNWSNSLESLGDFQYMVPKEIEPDRNSEKCRQLGLKLRKVHNEESEFTDSAFKFLDIIKFKSFWHGIHRTVLSRQQYSNSSTYLYRFNFDSPDFNMLRYLKCENSVRGVSHGDDIGYMFHNALLYVPANDSPEFKAIEQFVSILTSFATTGNPNIEGITPEPWKSISKKDNIHKCLNFSNNLEIIDLPESKKLAAWDSIYPKEMLI